MAAESEEQAQKIKVSQLPSITRGEVVPSDKIVILDRSATTGPGSGPEGTLKILDASAAIPFGTSKGVLYDLSLVGITTENVPMLTWAAEAINAQGPFSGVHGQDLYFRTNQPAGFDTFTVTTTYFKLISGFITVGGVAVNVSPSDLILSGGPWTTSSESDPDLFLNIGDIGAGPIETFFNQGRNQHGDPWEITTQQFLTGVMNGENITWHFLRGEGNYGGNSGMTTTADDFINLSHQPPAIGFELKKIHNLSLASININQQENAYIAEAINNYGPFRCLPGQQMVFKVQTHYGNQANAGVRIRYYELTRNYTTVGGGTSYNFVLPAWIKPDGESKFINPDEEGVIAELGDIGTDNVWDVFNLGDNGEAWDMNDYRFVRATQNGEVMFWAFTGQERFYGGPDMNVEPDIFEAFESDFFLITDQPQPPSSDFRIIRYEFITDEMLTDQADQSTQNIIFVEKAHEDPSLNFPQGETRTYAYYQLRSNSIKTESLSDYRLISAPWVESGGGGGGVNELQYNLLSQMLLGQGGQLENQTIRVDDASADTNLIFPAGANKVAYYKYNGVAGSPASIADYTLISAPYALSQTVVDAIAPKLIVKTANFTINPIDDNQAIIINKGFTCTLNPNLAFTEGFSIAMKNDSNASSTIVMQAKAGTTFSVNGSAPVASGTIFLAEGGTCTIVFSLTDSKFYLDGSLI